jgi:hypothetical protein
LVCPVMGKQCFTEKEQRCSSFCCNEGGRFMYFDDRTYFNKATISVDAPFLQQIGCL